MASARTRVAIVEDHRMVAEGIVLALAGATDVEVVGVGGSVAEARELVRRERPDVVLLDHRLPDGDGVTFAGELQDEPWAPAVVIVTSHADAALARQAIANGCLGFIVKHEGLDEVRRAVRGAARGESHISSAVLGALIRTTPATGNSRLTHRELEVLQLLSDGASTADVARRLFVSVNTVRNHVQNLLTKLDAHSKLEAVAIGVRAGIIRRV